MAPEWRGDPRLIATSRSAVPPCLGFARATSSRRGRSGGSLSLSASLLSSVSGGPAEVGAIAPPAMQDDGHLAGEADLAVLEAEALGEPDGPGLEGAPAADAAQQHGSGLEQIAAQPAIAALGDAAAVGELARAVAAR